MVIGLMARSLTRSPSRGVRQERILEAQGLQTVGELRPRLLMREVPTVLLVIGILALAAVPAALALWLFN
jgi:hypothetical protein